MSSKTPSKKDIIDAINKKVKKTSLTNSSNIKKVATPKPISYDNQVVKQISKPSLESKVSTLIDNRCRYWIENRISQLLASDNFTTREGYSFSIDNDRTNAGLCFRFTKNGNTIAKIDSNGYLYCANVFANGTNLMNIAKIVNDINANGSIYVKHAQLKDGEYVMDIDKMTANTIKVKNKLNIDDSTITSTTINDSTTLNISSDTVNINDLIADEGNFNSLKVNDSDVVVWNDVNTQYPYVVDDKIIMTLSDGSTNIGNELKFHYLNSSTSDAFIKLLNYMLNTNRCIYVQPSNMATNTTYDCLLLGYDNSTNNSGIIRFYYNNNNSASNALILGLKNRDLLKLTNYEATITASALNVFQSSGSYYELNLGRNDATGWATLQYVYGNGNPNTQQLILFMNGDEQFIINKNDSYWYKPLTIMNEDAETLLNCFNSTSLTNASFNIGAEEDNCFNINYHYDSTDPYVDLALYFSSVNYSIINLHYNFIHMKRRTYITVERAETDNPLGIYRGNMIANDVCYLSIGAGETLNNRAAIGYSHSTTDNTDNNNNLFLFMSDYIMRLYNSKVNIYKPLFINTTTSTALTLNVASSGGNWDKALDIFSPNLTNGMGVGIRFGKDATYSYNSVDIVYHHVANGSTSNYVSYAINGEVNMYHYATGQTLINGNIETSSNNPNNAIGSNLQTAILSLVFPIIYPVGSIYTTSTAPANMPNVVFNSSSGIVQCNMYGCFFDLIPGHKFLKNIYWYFDKSGNFVALDNYGAQGGSETHGHTYGVKYGGWYSELHGCNGGDFINLYDNGGWGGKLQNVGSVNATSWYASSETHNMAVYTATATTEVVKTLPPYYCVWMWMRSA